MESKCPKTCLFVLLLLICGIDTIHAQDVLVRSGFFMDSLRVGDQTRFFLAAEYPSNLNILFPDSTYNFAPFEYERRQYFPTKTTANRSYDSVVYYLSTFEVDRVQSLSLPVFQLNPMDCTAHVSDRDTILLTSLLRELPDTLSAQNLPLKVNTAYQNVLYLFNYPVLIIVLVVLLVVAVAVWVAFGKKIIRHFRIKRMQKAHQKFVETYTRQLENISVAFSSITTENALSQWKKYMEKSGGQTLHKTYDTRDTANGEK